MKIGIYGGTFDPIHNGHLRVVVELLTRKVVDQIILVPAGAPQLRQNPPKADGPTRLQMCNLAIADLPKELKHQVLVSDIEINRAGPSFAIDTVNEIKGDSSKHEYFWIIGSDAYEKIDQWHRAKELKELVSFIVIDRPSNAGDTSDNSDSSEGLDIGELDISAPEIRSDKSVHGVSPSVRKFIIERKLYAS